jgi:hypothetical protein
MGQYGPIFLAKRADRTIPLWVLFVAVQFLDVLWSRSSYSAALRLCALSSSERRRPLLHRVARASRDDAALMLPAQPRHPLLRVPHDRLQLRVRRLP